MRNRQRMLFIGLIFVFSISGFFMGTNIGENNNKKRTIEERAVIRYLGGLSHKMKNSPGERKVIQTKIKCIKDLQILKILSTNAKNPDIQAVYRILDIQIGRLEKLTNNELRDVGAQLEVVLEHLTGNSQPKKALEEASKLRILVDKVYD